jgi:hypothetical protein
MGAMGGEIYRAANLSNSDKKKKEKRVSKNFENTLLLL